MGFSKRGFLKSVGAVGLLAGGTVGGAGAYCEVSGCSSVRNSVKYEPPVQRQWTLSQGVPPQLIETDSDRLYTATGATIQAHQSSSGNTQWSYTPETAFQNPRVVETRQVNDQLLVRINSNEPRQEVHALSLTGGQRDRRVAVNEALYPRPAGFSDSLIVFQGPNKISTYSVPEGTRQWYRQLESDPTDVTIHDGTVYVAEYRAARISAFDLELGTPLWTFRSTARECHGLTIANDRVYVLDTEGLLVLSKEGDGLWRNQFTQSRGGEHRRLQNMVQTVGDIVFATGTDLHAFDITEGNPQYGYTGGEQVSPPAIVESTGYFVERLADYKFAQPDAVLHAFDPATGDQRGAKVFDSNNISPPVAAHGQIYTTVNGSLTAYRPQT